MDIGVEIKGQYRVVEHIGRGGMADVWSATDLRLNRMVAIKTIAHGLSDDDDPVGRFEREAQTIAKLDHPHILPIYDFGEFQGQLYIVMRFVTGGSLEDLLERGPMPVGDIMRMGEAVADALEYAHANKVIHLDLKPPNILLDSSNRPYLADFGLATRLDPEGHARNPGAGTLLYMAPEQLTADVLDNRADIYAFAVMLFHMLTGQLPFDATTALALKQLQFQDELPDMDQIDSSFPPDLTTVLRRGTALSVDDRYKSVLEFMRDVRHVVGGAAAAADTAYDADAFEVAGGEVEDEFGLPDLPAQVIGTDDMELLEAVDLYSRARHAWAGGRGRFLLGVTHFMLMNGYYMNAGQHGLEIDEAGLQMLLRGALEYDHQADYWWDRLDDENRRWVCLHAVRSANAPTRIRALYRLETLPDSDPPQIPRLVAQALQVETNEDAKIAALYVLGTRARIMKERPDYEVKTEYRGRLLTTMTRIGLQLGPPTIWHDVVYTPEIDTLIAGVALDYGMPAVAEFAARIIGRMRSLAAVRHIAEQQRLGTRGALRALALVRDEAPSLPSVVSAQGRLYAWLANTWRRISDNPMSIVWRYLLALIGGALAMGAHVFITYRSEAIFTPQRWGNTIAIGLVFGVFVGFLVLLADELPRRLRGFWPWWARFVVSALLGFGLGTLTWAAFTWFFLQYTPEWGVMRAAGFGLALGFVAASMFNLRGWQAFIVTVIGTYLPIYGAYRSFQFYEFPVTITSAFGLILGTMIGFSARWSGGFSIHWQTSLPAWGRLVLSGVFGVIWALASWAVYGHFLQAGAVWWDGICLVTLLGMVIGLLASVVLNRANWLAFAAAGLLVYGGFFFAMNAKFIGSDLLPQPLLFVLYYDHPEQIFTVAIPIALLIALGGYAVALYGDAALALSYLRGRAPGKRPAIVSPARVDFVGQDPTQPGRQRYFSHADERKRAELITELDLGDVASVPDPMATELDVQSGFDKLDVRRGMSGIPAVDLGELKTDADREDSEDEDES